MDMPEYIPSGTSFPDHSNCQAPELTTVVDLATPASVAVMMTESPSESLAMPLRVILFVN
ncbi:hypothetical protein D3C74_253340 [compost metagenome]